MTIWDKIYKKHQKFGEYKFIFSEEIFPAFKEFLTQENFESKHVLDIGCGTGKYLKTLQDNGFKTYGVDSSKTAIGMSRKILGNNSNLFCENMFEFEIPKNKFDLIISVSTIHHGTKEQVQSLVNKIHDAIIDNGKIFITLPNIGNAVEKGFFKNEQNLGNGTYAPTSGEEKGLPHSHYTKKEIMELFSKFKNLKIVLDKDGRKLGRWVVQGYK